MTAVLSDRSALPPVPTDWLGFVGGELVKCPAPALEARYSGHRCGRWFLEVGDGLTVLVRVQPGPGAASHRPTAPGLLVHRCTKCGAHLELAVGPAGAR